MVYIIIEIFDPYFLITAHLPPLPVDTRRLVHHSGTLVLL